MGNNNSHSRILRFFRWHFRGCLRCIIAIMVFAHCEMSVGVSQAGDLGVNDIQGTWNNDNTGENIAITGRTIQDSRLGEARITESVDWASNFVVTYQNNIHCWYFLTLTKPQGRLNVAIRHKDDSDNYNSCMSGVFHFVNSTAWQAGRVLQTIPTLLPLMWRGVGCLRTGTFGWGMLVQGTSEYNGTLVKRQADSLT
jgi:hypothetical protein